jgi:hypothetical protein
MHPACQLCRGACCESLVLNLPPTDAGTWLGLHGKPITGPVGGGTHEIEARCTKLSSCGRCTIHTTRPEHCKSYAVGGADCRATVARRRPRHAPAILAILDRYSGKAAA